MTALGQDEKFFVQRYLFFVQRYLYVAAIEGRDLCKIGVSKKPKRRIAGLSSTQPHKANLVKQWPRAGLFEKVIHKIFKPMRVRGEWFKCDPKFVEWVCDNVLSGGREKAEKAATLFCELNRLEIHPERHILDESLHNLGFDTVGYRIKAAVLRERANREVPVPKLCVMSRTITART